MKVKSQLLKKVALFISFIFLLPCKDTLAQEYNHDSKAGMIANTSLEAMGGRKNYNDVRYISWLFFGRRFHVWDKHTGDIRIEYGEGKNNLLLMNIHNKKGRVWENGKEVKDKALLAEKMKWGYEVWINDSYWVVMPYKLHDPGVNLTYSREDKSSDGRPVDVLTMTFNEVGVTPENKYEVFIDKESHFITEFSYYPKVEDKEPKFLLPWKNWRPYGKIMLSDNRGENGMAPLNTFATLPTEIFNQYSPAKDTKGKYIAGSMLR
ncbi:hypothetical protein [Agarilytica rhodophyticola]|uniref:hypothetical protein n=1 Tax=Agarilytica rhodophyticola TaxID=1737490 RepID=UPI000B343F50|nr:hypothetical protein [Agarilytica rhodophyticola]